MDQKRELLIKAENWLGKAINSDSLGEGDTRSWRELSTVTNPESLKKGKKNKIKKNSRKLKKVMNKLKKFMAMSSGGGGSWGQGGINNSAGPDKKTWG